MTPLPLLAAAAILCGTIIEGVRRWGLRALLDIPNVRSSHHRPTPRGGGLGIIAGTVGVWAAWLCLADPGGTVQAWAVLAGVIVVALVSWIDDLRGLRFSERLVVHLIAAIGITPALGPFHLVGTSTFGTVSFGWAAWPLTICWIVGLTNAYNFMDGIDGIAGGQGVVAGVAWWILGTIAGVPAVATLGLLIAVTCFVFLCFNWSPARIFMGDVGSASLGFAFAAMPLLVLHDAPAGAPWAVVTGVSVVWPFVFDASFTFLRRWRRGENVFAAHRSHLYQRMVIAGWSHRRVSALYIACAAISVAAGVAVSTGAAWSGIAGLVVAVTVGVELWGLTVWLEGKSAVKSEK